MNIAMMAYTESGGAGRASVRLMDGLNRLSDVSCDMIVQERNSNHPRVMSAERKNPFFQHIQEKWFSSNVPNGHVLMSLMYSGKEKEYLGMLEAYEIIHFHWISNFVSVESMDYMQKQGKYLVWTLHDRNPMTGGCHCTYGCNGYIDDCNNCPEMRINPYNITKHILRQKKQYIPKNLVVVAPSQWMAECARKSAVFHENRIEVIPNSIDTSLFYNHDRNVAKESLGISATSKAILYCAESPEQVHKGYNYFFTAMQWLQKKVRENNSYVEVVLILVGSSEKIIEDTKKLDMRVLPLGYVKDDVVLSKVYSAADVTVIPSMEDNFPNVMLESLACGTPVVGFRTGGIPDVIRDGYNGYVVPQGDSVALGIGILKVLDGNETEMSIKCRNYAEKNLSIETQAIRYKNLYEDIMLDARELKGKDIFIMPIESHRLLAPYYAESMNYLIGLNDRVAHAFLHNKSMEDLAIDYMISHLEKFDSYPDKSIAVWGIGVFCKKLMEEMFQKNSAIKRKIYGFFDSSVQCDSFMGFPCLQTEKIQEYGLSAIIIGSIQYEDEIYHQLYKCEELGIERIRLGNFLKDDL